MSIPTTLKKWLMVLGTAAAIAGLVAVVSVIEARRRSQRQALSVVEGRSVVRMIADKYGVEVVDNNHVYPVKTFHGPIQARNAESARVDRYSTILASEFSVYPPDFIRRSRLKRIVLCRGLSFNGQYRAAVPDFEHDTLYLDVMAGDHSRDYQRRVIHHDFFHMVDYRDDGELYVDIPWARLNPATFRYGTGGTKMQDDVQSSALWNQAGFLTRYATAGVEEDKAEMFAHMMTEYSVVASRAATDSVVHAKMSFMKALLEKFCPAMNETFWQDLEKGQAPTQSPPSRR